MLHLRSVFLAVIVLAASSVAAQQNPDTVLSNKDLSEVRVRNNKKRIAVHKITGFPAFDSFEQGPALPTTLCPPECFPAAGIGRGRQMSLNPWLVFCWRNRIGATITRSSCPTLFPLPSSLTFSCSVTSPLYPVLLALSRISYLAPSKHCVRPFLPSLLWGAALVALFFLDPSADGPSLCIFKALGVTWCPGCGLGHAVHYALHGQWRASIDAHWLGIPVTALLLQQMIKPLLQKHKLQNHHSWTSTK